MVIILLQYISLKEWVTEPKSTTLLFFGNQKLVSSTPSIILLSLTVTSIKLSSELIPALLVCVQTKFPSCPINKNSLIEFLR